MRLAPGSKDLALGFGLYAACPCDLHLLLRVPFRCTRTSAFTSTPAPTPSRPILASRFVDVVCIKGIPLFVIMHPWPSLQRISPHPTPTPLHPPPQVPAPNSRWAV